MSNPFVGEIKLFGGNFAPKGWAQCNGQLLSIGQNSALFSLIGISYGGDGVNFFALPNLMDRIPLGQGQGPGLTPRPIGESGGEDIVTLEVDHLPAHNHSINAIRIPGDVNDPSLPEMRIAISSGAAIYNPAPTAFHPMYKYTLMGFGGDQPHNNAQPCIALNFIIALFGIFPPRNV